MKGLGSGDNGELTFLDMLSVISFYVGLQNLELNIGQKDLDNQTQELDRRLKEVVDDIHKHLQAQDLKIDSIIEVLNYDENQEVGRRDQG